MKLLQRADRLSFPFSDDCRGNEHPDDGVPAVQHGENLLPKLGPPHEAD